MHSVDLERRIQSLEERVDTLEQDRDVHTEAAGTKGEGLWALDVLRRRSGAPYDDGDVSGGLIFAGTSSTPGAGDIVWQEEHPVPAVLAADWREAAPVLSALGHPIRLELVRRMLTGAHTTQELAATPGLGTTGQLYHHLKELQSAGLVIQRRRSRYAVNPDRVVPCLILVAAAAGGGRLAPPEEDDER